MKTSSHELMQRFCRFQTFNQSFCDGWLAALRPSLILLRHFFSSIVGSLPSVLSAQRISGIMATVVRLHILSSKHGDVTYTALIPVVTENKLRIINEFIQEIKLHIIVPSPQRSYKRPIPSVHLSHHHHFERGQKIHLGVRVCL